MELRFGENIIYLMNSKSLIKLTRDIAKSVALKTDKGN